MLLSQRMEAGMLICQQVGAQHIDRHVALMQLLLKHQECGYKFSGRAATFSCPDGEETR